MLDPLSFQWFLLYNLLLSASGKEHFMKLGLIQIRVAEKLGDNLMQLEEGLKGCVEEHVDLVILPELWNTPFRNACIQEHYTDFQVLIPSLKLLAKRCHVWLVAGTLPVPDKASDQYTNCCLIINSEGEVVKAAAKLHLLEVNNSRHSYKESEVFHAGDEPCLVKTPWGVMGVEICFDLRFPELSRILSQSSFLLAVPAGFNAAVGQKHWKPLIQSRAIENEIFVAGVNPQAADYGTYSSYGHSMVCSPDGEILLEMKPDQLYATVEIDTHEVERIRKRSPFWKLRRTDLYSLLPLDKEAGKTRTSERTQHEENSIQ